MARKSRKPKKEERNLIVETASVEEVPTASKLTAAAYIRLSSENGGHGEERDTVETQLALVKGYIGSNDELEYVGEYIDNGYSGTRFDRPEFQHLMEDVHRGKVQCVVVKDLSRFGRDYLEIGYYLESIFPKLGVRFIAVTDNFDSFRAEDRNNLSVPIKNMVNAFYAKDISKKIGTVKAVKAENGEVMSTFHPYGYYVKDGEKHYSVDEKAAPYLKMIYEWYMIGVPIAKIADRLNLLGAPTPRKRQYYHITGQELNDGKIWVDSSISKLLHNPVYMGNMYTGKSKSAYYKGQPHKWIDKSEWIVTMDTHRALIAADDYADIEERKEQRGAKFKQSQEALSKVVKPNLFRGRVYCAVCREHMIRNVGYSNYKTKQNPIVRFACRSHKGEKHRNVIYDATLTALVEKQIRAFVRNLCDKKRILEGIRQSGDNSGKLGTLKKRIDGLRKKISQAESRKDNLYEDYASGVLTYEDYRNLREHYILELQNLNGELFSLEQEHGKTEREQSRMIGELTELEKLIDDNGCMPQLIDRLVDRIYVQDDSIEIVFKCDDMCERIEEMTAGENI